MSLQKSRKISKQSKHGLMLIFFGPTQWHHNYDIRSQSVPFWFRHRFLSRSSENWWRYWKYGSGTWCYKSVQSWNLYSGQYGYTHPALLINKRLLGEHGLGCATARILVIWVRTTLFSIFNYRLQKKRENPHVEKKNRKKNWHVNKHLMLRLEVIKKLRKELSKRHL